MAITLIERPYRFGFTKNESRYVFTVTNPLSAGCAVQVRLFYHTITSASAPPILITDIQLFPTPDGNVIFYAESYFESILKLQMPSPGSTAAVAAVSQHCYYWIEFRQITDALPNNAWVIAERTRKRIMMLGGVEVQKFERNNFFINYLIANKWWMTWLPSNVNEGYPFVALDQEHYISWLRTGDAPSAAKLYAKVFYTDSTEEETDIDIEDADKSFLFHWPAGVEQLGLSALNPAKKIHYYELRVEDATLGVLANPYRYYINYDYSYQKINWVYLNSLGGLDAARVLGRFTRDFEREVSTAARLNLTTAINDDVKNSDSIDTGILLTKKWKGDLGWHNTPAEQDGRADLLVSTEIFEKIDNRWLRVRLLMKTQPMAGTEDKKWNFPIEFVYAFINSVFTPDKKLFGAGSNSGEVYDGIVSACPAPTGLGAAEISVDSGLSSVEFTWTHPGNTLITIQTKEDGTTDWVDTFTNATGAPLFVVQFVADGRTMNWRLKLKCPNDDESVYVNGPNFVLTDDASACALPTLLSWTKGTPSGGLIPFTFEWAHALPAGDFNLQYREVGTSTWTDVPVSALTTVINFADDAKLYEWRVKAICGVGSESPYVNGSNFIASSAVTCTNPYSLSASIIDTSGSIKTVRFSWSHPGASSFQLVWSSRIGNTEVVIVPGALFVDIPFDVSEERIFWEVAAECTGGDFSESVNGFPINL